MAYLNAFSVRAPISALLALGGPISALLTWRAVFRNSWPGKLLLEVETIFLRFVTLKNMQIDTLNIIFGHHEIMPRGGYTSTWKSWRPGPKCLASLYFVVPPGYSVATRTKNIMSPKLVVITSYPRGEKVKRTLLHKKQWYTMGLFILSIYPFKNNTPYLRFWIGTVWYDLVVIC